jgi:hypothetical protein
MEIVRLPITHFEENYAPARSKTSAP